MDNLAGNTNRKPRVAVCFSGQPRFLDIEFERITNTFIKPYDADVFTHFWWDPSYAGMPYDFSPHASERKGMFAADTDKLVREMYQPRRMLAEPQIHFDMSDFSGANFEMQSPHILKSMWYSVFKANELKQEYENEKRFVYDVVIRCRFDLVIESFSLKLENLDPQMVYVSGEIEPQLNDQCAIGSSSVIDRYAELFYLLSDYYNHYQLPSMVNERVLSFHIQNKNIPVHYCSYREMRVDVVKVGQTEKFSRRLRRMARRMLQGP